MMRKMLRLLEFQYVCEKGLSLRRWEGGAQAGGGMMDKRSGLE